MTAAEVAVKEKQELQQQEQTRPGRFYVPDVDIFEDEHSLWVQADMPGVEQPNVEVELDDNVLTLMGKVSLENYRGLSPRHTEYNVGHYLRRFTLVDAANFDHERITARIDNGILKVQLPKAERAKRRRIPVNTN
jgi:HSP20 family molecular chaperone IbpA